MPSASSRLAVDLSGSLIRVLEGTMGGSMRCGSAGLPEGAVSAGKVVDPSVVGLTLKQVLARTDITETRALLAVSDAVATFHVLNLAASATDKDVGAAISRELPLDPERIATRWIDVAGPREQRVVYAVAWERAALKSITDAVKLAGLEPVVVELKSASVARSVSEASCVVVDLSSDPAEIVLIDHHVPRMWHSFKLDVPQNDDVAPVLATPLRSVLRFFMRGLSGNFLHALPILVSSEQMLPAHVISELSGLLDQPVQPLPPPSRVPSNVRHSTYLACLGLIMRRNM